MMKTMTEADEVLLMLARPPWMDLGEESSPRVFEIVERERERAFSVDM